MGRKKLRVGRSQHEVCCFSLIKDEVDFSLELFKKVVHGGIRFILVFRSDGEVNFLSHNRK